MHAHIIGIAGVGMGATAILLRESGWSVSGSDEGAYPPMSTFLASKEIHIHTPYSPTNIPTHVDLFVVGKNAKLTDENLEVQAARKYGVPVRDFAQVVGDLIKNRVVIAATGSSGKSTCTALLAWTLQAAEPDVGYFIGALARGFPLPSHRGTSPHFVIEGDEYPTGHHDHESKFMHYHVHDALITSIEHDHANIFPTPASYIERFRKLVEQIPHQGMIAACGDHFAMKGFLESTGRPYVLYGLSESHPWHAQDITYGETTRFNLVGPHGCTPIETSLLGAHNVQNIVGCAALLLGKGLVTPTQFATQVASFTGIRRRLDKCTSTSHIPLYEGFGSSKEKARAAITALRAHSPHRRLVVLFEPHTFSWRNKNMLHWYDSTFDEAALVIVHHPGTHGSTTHEQAAHEDIVARLAAHNVRAISTQSSSDILHALTRELRAGDILLALTSGNFDGALDTLPAWMDKRYQR